MTLVDLHCHMLPNVDDGSPDFSSSIELAKSSVNDGISHILLTPHHMDSQYKNPKIMVLEKVRNFQSCLDEAGIPITVFPGQEVHLTGALISAIEKDDVIFMDANNKYLLLEFPHSDIPAYTSNVIFELLSRGIVPVIAHPERNREVQKNPRKLHELISQGCLSQITASSYLGVFGEKVQETSQKIIESNLAHVISSDAHVLTGRQFRMADAFEKLSNFDNQISQNFMDNAKSILNGEVVVSDSPICIEPITKKKFFFF
ncbi:tyrosine-protein phosphatase [Companilactobacillus ginsenosidimutans]|uniref:Tyrosine-protein phosphatase n=1 Tax=Companilactobacillus ginsenosidimutans TaxID=1007676 RepID=A0A0H4QL22_9LACO|nr:CpsB/CapC family capsule biosynthesis tyrosine phosphatase [Companilactobacillus ginsenosidimutans]AKP67398.1 tyrosine protein phosphatase [Companilactobacillus ginsenosidimutans]